MNKTPKFVQITVLALLCAGNVFGQDSINFDIDGFQSNNGGSVEPCAQLAKVSLSTSDRRTI